MKKIFLDNASTTKCYEEVAEVVKTALVEDYFNPGAKYDEAFKETMKLNESRETILNSLNVSTGDFDVVFTGSATEANNLALSSNINKHNLSLVTIGEHSSSYEVSKNLKQNGFKVEFIPLNKNGFVSLDELKQVMTKDTNFVSLIFVSNETGSITNIKEVVEFLRDVNPKVLIHVDAVQGYMKEEIDILDWGVDYITISAHKIHGPKGIGALVYRKKAKLIPQILGGGQENGKRSGTENLPLVLGFKRAVEINEKFREENHKKVEAFKEKLMERLVFYSNEENVKISFNGDQKNASPYILSLSILNVKAEVLVHILEKNGILVGTGSACNSKHSGNRVLSAMGKSTSEIEGNIRLSFSVENTIEDCDKIAKTIINSAKGIVEK